MDRNAAECRSRLVRNSIVRYCRLEDDGEGTFDSSTPRDITRGTPPLDPPLYYTSDLPYAHVFGTRIN